MKKLTKTQAAVLDFLRKLQANAEMSEARGFGKSLTDKGRLDLRGIDPYEIYSRTGIRGASIRTLQALAEQGLVECISGVWVAK